MIKNAKKLTLDFNFDKTIADLVLDMIDIAHAFK
jgi:hypothetical protein